MAKTSLTILGAKGSYRARLQWTSIIRDGNRETIDIHHSMGHSLSVKCREFTRSADDQTTFWGKSKDGWKSLQTRALCLDSDVSEHQIDTYVSQCAENCIQQIPDGPEVIRLLGDRSLSKFPLVVVALKLWTANRLLVQGWEVEGAPLVADLDSPFLGKAPAPRVLHNELDLKLETYIQKLELGLLNQVQKSLELQLPGDPLELLVATYIMLSAIERDTWRLLYWIRHKEEVRTPNAYASLLDSHPW